jgi:ribonuclease HI
LCALLSSNIHRDDYVASIHPDVPEPDRKGKKAAMLPLAPAAELATVAPSNWQAPEAGWIKVNVDAGWNMSYTAGGAAMVVRDSTGSVLFSEWKTLPPCASVEEAEILACLEGIRYLAAHPQCPGVLETDCARIIDVLTSTEKDRSTNWSLLLEAKALLDLLPVVKVCKVSRVSNKVAHDLAQLGKRECGVLHKAVPPCALDSLLHECNATVA